MTGRLDPLVHTFRSAWKRIPHFLVSSILTLIVAVAAAWALETFPLFHRISLTVSDEVARKLPIRKVGNVELVQINQPFSKSEVQEVTAAAIKRLMETYQAVAVGVDINFSSGDYSLLSQRVTDWTAQNPALAAKVVWAVGFASNSKSQGDEGTQEAMAACRDCSDVGCSARFTPTPVFENGRVPLNYGLAIAWPDLDGVHRRSSRFVCHSSIEAPLQTFHFALVDAYCKGRTDIATCRDLSPNRQAETKIYSWYRADPIDVCELVNCTGNGDRAVTETSDSSDSPETAASSPNRYEVKSKDDVLARQLAGKIVVLYSDIPRDDEHLTMVSTQKGAQVVASLIENEVRFGVLPSWRVTVLEFGLKILVALLLGYLFHSPATRRWAILPALVVFLLYLMLVPTLAAWVPDFRDYVFALVLCFWMEVLLKEAWMNFSSADPAGSHAARA